MNIHLISPVIYIIFIEAIKFASPCPNSKFMINCRKYHNINLSFLSFIILCGISYSTYIDNKFSSFHNLACLPYSQKNYIAIFSSKLFLYSKYIEWLDTLFIHLSNRKITMLQYTHHMTTAFLTYLNMDEFMSASYFIPTFLNTFVHIFMYLYFAFPKGVLFKFRSLITKIQIIQHVICLTAICYVLFYATSCNTQTKYGASFGLLLYGIYLYYFLEFYISNYLIKKLK